MQLNRLTDYAVVILSCLARPPAKGDLVVEEGFRLMSASALSDYTAIPLPTVSKVLKVLAKSKLLTSIRGVSGGYSIAKPAEEISVADIIAAVEGPIALTACIDGSEMECGVESFCAMRGNWQQVNLAVQQALQNVSLADMEPSFLIVDQIAKSQEKLTRVEH